MTVSQIEHLTALISGGIGLTAQVVMGVKVMVGALSPGLSDVELDAQVDAIVADATTRMNERQSMIGG